MLIAAIIILGVASLLYGWSSSQTHGDPISWTPTFTLWGRMGRLDAGCFWILLYLALGIVGVTFTWLSTRWTWGLVSVAALWAASFVSEAVFAWVRDRRIAGTSRKLDGTQVDAGRSDEGGVNLAKQILTYLRWWGH